MSHHLSRFGVYNDTSKGWCFLDAGGFRGSLVACEASLAGFRSEYPDNVYRIAEHRDGCQSRVLSDCCKPLSEQST